jgi:hypothetical protein
MRSNVYGDSALVNAAGGAVARPLHPERNKSALPAAWVSGFVRGGTSLGARDEADTKSRCSGPPACSQGPQLFSPSLAGRLPNVLLSR